MVKSKLKVIAFDNCINLGKKVDKYLQKELKTKKTNLVNVTCTRFANGEGKSYIDESISDKDLYILSDIGNYGIKYDLYGESHSMSPDEHFQDIKRVISAANGRFKKITVIMPLLYQSRQHRRRERESLDCALALQELENIGTGTGYYISNGYSIPITWEKSSHSGQTIYKDMNGEKLKVNDGNTFIQICPTDAEISITE